MGKLALAFQDDAALLYGDPAGRDKLLDQMRSMGGKYVRANVLYGQTQGGKDLSQLDSLVDAAKSRGLRVQATLMSDPRYAQSNSKLRFDRQTPKDWASFAKTVAQHEKGRIGRYSVGNEMNYPAFNEGADKDSRAAGVRYRQQYRAGYNALKGVDRSNQVLLGELTPGGGDPRQFLAGLLGGKPLKTTGLAYHPYDMSHAVPSQRKRWDINSLSGLQETLGRYKRSGQLQTAQGKQAGLYLTEFGYQRGTMPEARRMQLNAQAISKAKRAGAKEFVQYQLTDKADQVAGTPDGYGGSGPGSTVRKYGWDTSVGSADGDLSTYMRAIRSRVRVR